MPRVRSRSTDGLAVSDPQPFVAAYTVDCYYLDVPAMKYTHVGFEPDWSGIDDAAFRTAAETLWENFDGVSCELCVTGAVGWTVYGDEDQYSAWNETVLVRGKAGRVAIVCIECGPYDPREQPPAQVDLNDVPREVPLTRASRDALRALITKEKDRLQAGLPGEPSDLADRVRQLVILDETYQALGAQPRHTTNLTDVTL
jgi:hypothetical protein